MVCEPAKLDDHGCIGAPDWIIEIISPSTASHDRQVTPWKFLIPNFRNIAASLFFSRRSVSALRCSVSALCYTGNTILQYEGFYVSVFYNYFAALGLDIRTEESTNHGCIDMAVLGQVYLFEFKVVEETPAGNALQQIRNMGYADKYRSLGYPIHLVGVEFSKTERNIVGFAVETI